MFSERLGGGTQLAQPETQEGWKGFRGYKWLRERERESFACILHIALSHYAGSREFIDKVIIQVLQSSEIFGCNHIQFRTNCAR